MNSVANLRKAFGINDSVGRGMPSLEDRQSKEMFDLDHESRGRMVNFTIQLLNSLCEAIYPKNPRALALEYAVRLNNGSSTMDDCKLREKANILATEITPKSIQHCVVFSLVSSAYNSKMLRTEFGMGKK